MQQNPTKDGLLLRPKGESLFLPQESGEAKGTVVLYHGYTASPWQYEEMAQELHSEGYNVYAPRLPGHGLASVKTGKASFKRMLGTSKQRQWTKFAQETVNEAKELGVPVHTVGLSGGANVAMKAAKGNSEISSVTALAPFLAGNGGTGVLFPVLNVVNLVTFGLFGRLLDRIPRKERPDELKLPKTEGTIGQALAMYRMGAQVKKMETTPLQLVTTHGDILSGTKQATKLVKRSKQNDQVGWYHFEAKEGVPHAMVSPLENPNKDSIETLTEIILDNLNGKQTRRPPET